MMEKTLAWHFTSGYELRDGKKLIAGKTYVYSGKPVMRRSGYHASEKIIDALTYAPGSILSHVECWNITDKDDDIFVCKKRKILWILDTEPILHEFACRCAEHAMRKYGNGDNRSLAAIAAKRKWLRDEITDKELLTVWNAAGAACSSASATAAKAAAKAGAAARAAAGARAAADARDATATAAWVRDAENRLLTAMVIKSRQKIERGK